MTPTSTTSPLAKHLFTVLLVACAVVFCTMGATSTAFAQPCDEGDVSAESDEPCSQPCPGESPEEGDCLDDCQFCNCCSMAAPAALASVAMGFGAAVPAFRGDLPPPMTATHGGINLRVFKPPRCFSA